MGFRVVVLVAYMVWYLVLRTCICCWARDLLFDLWMWGSHVSGVSCDDITLETPWMPQHHIIEMRSLNPNIFPVIR